MFQKRHYEFLATWLRELTIPADIRYIVLLSLVTRLKEESPNFKPEKFWKWVLNG